MKERINKTLKRTQKIKCYFVINTFAWKQSGIWYSNTKITVQSHVIAFSK